MLNATARDDTIGANATLVFTVIIKYTSISPEYAIQLQKHEPTEKSHRQTSMQYLQLNRIVIAVILQTIELLRDLCSYYLGYNHRNRLI